MLQDGLLGVDEDAYRVVADRRAGKKQVALACLHELAGNRPAVVVGEGEAGVVKAVQVVAHICSDARELGQGRPLVFPTIVAQGHGYNEKGKGVGAAEGFRSDPRGKAPQGDGGSESRLRGNNERQVLTQSGARYRRPAVGTVTSRSSREAPREGQVQVTFAIMPGSVME